MEQVDRRPFGGLPMVWVGTCQAQTVGTLGRRVRVDYTSMDLLGTVTVQVGMPSIHWRLPVQQPQGGRVARCGGLPGRVAHLNT